MRANSLLRVDSKKVVFKDHHFLLTAEDGGDPDLSQGFIFSHGTERHFNLAVLNALGSEHKLTIASKTYDDVGYGPLEPGVYKIQIEVRGKNCGPINKTIGIKYDGGEKISFVLD
jgi:hypothetical protein